MVYLTEAVRRLAKICSSVMTECVRNPQLTDHPVIQNLFAYRVSEMNSTQALRLVNSYGRLGSVRKLITVLIRQRSTKCQQNNAHNLLTLCRLTNLNAVECFEFSI